MYVTLPQRRALEFGIYRDGDNNLDEVQDSVLDQAFRTSAANSSIEFTVENTSTIHSIAGHPFDRVDNGDMATDEFQVDDGAMRAFHGNQRPHEMSDERNLARFVANTLDNAQRCGARQTWIELVDHGGGDGGGLETSDGRVMSMPDIARAIAEGVAMHAREHPGDTARRVDGVVANQCLMATLGFTDALSRAGVTYLAASPETMVAPGTPTCVADSISKNEKDPQAMAKAIVADAMRARFDDGLAGTYEPAAAFDVLDCAPQLVRRAEEAIRALNDAVVVRSSDETTRAEIRSDIASVDGMARIPDAGALPYRADRPAIAVYTRLADDGRLDARLRIAAHDAASAVQGLILAHAESAHFAPFGGADYRDAAGPTVHLPTSRKEVDPWAPRISETKNAFYHTVHAPALARAIA